MMSNYSPLVVSATGGQATDPSTKEPSSFNG